MSNSEMNFVYFLFIFAASALYFAVTSSHSHELQMKQVELLIEKAKHPECKPGGVVYEY